MASSLLVSFLLLSFLSFASPLPSDTILDAAEILSDSGFVSMALTLEIVSQTLTVQSPSLTIFAPNDSAFSQAGQPSLSLLQFHFCPIPLPLESLKLLSTGTKIPTLLSGHSLIVTSSPSSDQISLNNVKITGGSPIYDDGSMIIFGIEDFFDPNFGLPVPISSPRSTPRCGSSSTNGSMDFPGVSWFEGASAALRSNGHSVMASFLDLQLEGFKEPTMMTIFAPVDQSMVNPMKNVSVFLRHVVPCKLLWNDLVNFDDGTVLPTYSNGFTITVTRSDSVLMLNGVPVFFPNMYFSDPLVVHGLNEVLAVQEKPKEMAELFYWTGEDGDQMLLGNDEF
ncbi:hypothetical protein FEM48_Zijuj10G0131200 [Ziziphus jujuba var. spinosa]|uniref:FAS1 domain-containing protein n=1 Tax=Ziziphus jujuba var. spinosa TaxID=714518 RepID=A0A978UNJ6_ZIZJJ|nr:hypothetical protein FEM48_Zijuj10G0131200 [Ziziphus jujuba var. spinosa]